MCTGGFRIEFHFALTPCETPWFTVVNSEGLRLCRDAHMQWGDLGHCGVCVHIMVALVVYGDMEH